MVQFLELLGLRQDRVIFIEEPVLRIDLPIVKTSSILFPTQVFAVVSNVAYYSGRVSDWAIVGGYFLVPCLNSCHRGEVPALSPTGPGVRILKFAETGFKVQIVGAPFRLVPRRMTHVFCSSACSATNIDSCGSRHSAQLSTVLQARRTNNQLAEAHPVAGELGVPSPKLTWSWLLRNDLGVDRN